MKGSFSSNRAWDVCSLGCIIYVDSWVVVVVDLKLCKLSQVCKIYKGFFGAS